MWDLETLKAINTPGAEKPSPTGPSLLVKLGVNRPTHDCYHPGDHPPEQCPEAPEPPPAWRWRCPDCGSYQVEAQAWIDANTEEVISEQEGVPYWCRACESEQKYLLAPGEEPEEV